MGMQRTLICCSLVLPILFCSNEARPQRQWRFTKGNSRTTGQSAGENTRVDTNSSINFGGAESHAFSGGTSIGEGLGPSESLLETFAGLGNLEGTAESGGSAVGQETAIETGNEVRVLGRGRGSRGRSRSRGKARTRGGNRKAGIDIEAGAGFTGISDAFGAAGGSITGDEAEITGASEADSILGGTSLAESGVRGRSRGQGKEIGNVELGAFAGVDGTEAEGDVLSIGNVEATGETKAKAVRNEHGESLTGVESSAGSKNFRGRSGARVGAGTGVGDTQVSATGESRASGTYTENRGRAKAVQTNSEAAGSAESQSKSSSTGGEGSFASSSAVVLVES